jgi:hypothetical protein
MRDDNDLFDFGKKITPINNRNVLCHSGKVPFHLILGEHEGPPLNEWWKAAAVYEKIIIQSDNVSIDDIMFAPRNSGLYVLFYQERLVYIGCTDNLHNRLKQHTSKLTSATLIQEEHALFRFVPVDQCGMLCLERCMIRYYTPEWNRTGFGRRPGKSLDLQRLSEWDMLYGHNPIIGGIREEEEEEEEDIIHDDDDYFQ